MSDQEIEIQERVNFHISGSGIAGDTRFSHHRMPRKGEIIQFYVEFLRSHTVYIASVVYAKNNIVGVICLYEMPNCYLEPSFNILELTNFGEPILKNYLKYKNDVAESRRK